MRANSAPWALQGRARGAACAKSCRRGRSSRAAAPLLRSARQRAHRARERAPLRRSARAVRRLGAKGKGLKGTRAFPVSSGPVTRRGAGCSWRRQANLGRTLQRAAGGCCRGGARCVLPVWWAQPASARWFRRRAVRQCDASSGASATHGMDRRGCVAQRASRRHGTADGDVLTHAARSTLMSPRASQVRGSDGDLPFLAPSHSAGVAKRKRPPNLDIAAICSWQPRHAQEEPPLGPRLREGSPRRNSCPQTVAASPVAPDRLFKRARRPGLMVRIVRCVDCASRLTVSRRHLLRPLAPAALPQRA